MLHNIPMIRMTLVVAVVTTAIPTFASPSSLTEIEAARSNTADAARMIAQTREEAVPAPGASSQPVPGFSDMEPDAWASSSVRSLMERYGCIAGFPDGQFRGEELMTRYQFAAGLDACLNRLDAILQSRIDELVTKEDLATLFRILASIFEQAPQQPDGGQNLQIPELPGQLPSPQPAPDETP